VDPSTAEVVNAAPPGRGPRHGRQRGSACGQMQELSSVGTFPILHDAARPVRRPTMLVSRCTLRERLQRQGGRPSSAPAGLGSTTALHATGRRG
jgi:hypothetical protein